MAAVDAEEKEWPLELFYSESLASFRSCLSSFSDSHETNLQQLDIDKKLGEISDWVEKQKQGADQKSKKEFVQNVSKVFTGTTNGVQKLVTGDQVGGTLDIISSATFTGEMIGGPVGAAVDAIVSTLCSIIGAIFKAFKPKQPSIVAQLAEVVHKEFVGFNKKLQDQKYNGLKGRVRNQAAQLREMKSGEGLDDPDLWNDYTQFMGELSERFESHLPFKYNEALTKDPGFNDCVMAVMKYRQAYSCYMALLMAAKGKFRDLAMGKEEAHVDRKISRQREEGKEKLAFLSDGRYLTFLGRLPYEGEKLTKIVAVSRNAEARRLVKLVAHGVGLPAMPDPSTVEWKAKVESDDRVRLKLERYPSPDKVIQFVNETDFPLKVICGTVGKYPKQHTFTQVVSPRSSYERPTLGGHFSVGGYMLIYLDSVLRADDEPSDADVTRRIEFACSYPYNGGKKIHIQDKTNGEFTKGKDTYDRMSDGETKNIFWKTEGKHYYGCAKYYVDHSRWQFVIQDYDPFPQCILF